MGNSQKVMRVILPATSIVDLSGVTTTQMVIPTIYEKDLGKYQSIYVENFQKNKTKSFSDYDDFPVIDFNKEKNKIYTGKYIGFLSHKVKNTTTQITINTGYHPELLYRMLDVSNEIYITQQHTDFINSHLNDLPKQIIEYLFLSALNKALINGIPCEYRIIERKDSNLSGKICLSKYIKNELGRSCYFSQKLNKRLPVKEICDVIYCTLSLIKTQKIKGYSRISKSLFCSDSTVASGITNKIINKAKTHNVLSNPLFSNYRKVLDYAEIILKNKGGLAAESVESETTYGFLIDVSALWENYLEKLLKKSLHQWKVSSQSPTIVCNKSFFERTIIPDFILENITSGKTVILDAKFKQMRFIKQDLDREDFYQIAYYHSYFYSDKAYKDSSLTSSTSFLIYPLSVNLPSISIEKRCSNLFSVKDNKDQLCITGIYVGPKDASIHISNPKNNKGEPETQKEFGDYHILEAEKEFISDIAAIINCNQ